MEQQSELKNTVSKMIAKQQALQEEVDYLLDAISEWQDKAQLGELRFGPSHARASCSTPVRKAKSTSHRSRLPTSMTEYSDDDDDDDDQSAVSESMPLAASDTLPAPASAPKRPRADATPAEADEDASLPEQTPTSPKRPRLS
ncbi:hypothetical protein ACI68E_001646 [Malassezia pachydermatis]